MNRAMMERSSGGTNRFFSSVLPARSFLYGSGASMALLLRPSLMKDKRGIEKQTRWSELQPCAAYNKVQIEHISSKVHD